LLTKNYEAFAFVLVIIIWRLAHNHHKEPVVTVIRSTADAKHKDDEGRKEAKKKIMCFMANYLLCSVCVIRAGG
jgi:hypothetical protein